VVSIIGIYVIFKYTPYQLTLKQDCRRMGSLAGGSLRTRVAFHRTLIFGLIRGITTLCHEFAKEEERPFYLDRIGMP